ncbi:cutinase [Flagelloscypha sp. PMI_526]|nr:cutinase [Flagelloscypha sp. PMI_526]
MFKFNIIVLATLYVATLATPVEVEKRACADVTTIFARGTTETPTIGTVVGPGLMADTATAISPKTLDFQGVDYPADVAGFLAGGDAQGSQTMANMAATALTNCPNTKIVLSGYSQGAQLVHNAAALISTTTANHVAAVVVFGDPDNGDAFGKGLDAKSITFCRDGDNICDGGDLILPPHLAYGADTGKAATFIASKV